MKRPVNIWDRRRGSRTVWFGLTVLTGFVVFWFCWSSSAHWVGAFSPQDFKEVQEAIRLAVLRKAATQPPSEVPASMWSLATSRIDQVDVFPKGEQVRVRVQTPKGLCLYLVRKQRLKPGQTGWQIKSSISPSPQLLEKMESWGNFAKLQVKGGFGLIGGKLPRAFITPAVYEGPVFLFEDLPDSTKQLTNEVTLTYGAQPKVAVDRDYVPRRTQSPQPPLKTVEQFSASLTNLNVLELKPSQPSVGYY